MRTAIIQSKDFLPHPLKVKIYARVQNNTNDPLRDRLIAVHDISTPDEFVAIAVDPGHYAIVDES